MVHSMQITIAKAIRLRETCSLKSLNAIDTKGHCEIGIRHLQRPTICRVRLKIISWCGILAPYPDIRRVELHAPFKEGQNIVPFVTLIADKLRPVIIATL